MEEKIPQQFEGKSFDYNKFVALASKEQAALFYERVKDHLLDINRWDKVAELPSATFTIKDAKGHTIDRLVQEGDHVQIDIPGPGLPSSKGYDWVEVVAIKETQSNEGVSIILTLRPAPDPTQDLTDTAHFFKQIASSSILLEQKDKNIYLHYAGRNEVINTDNASLLDNLRNFMVGIGAKLGVSFPQWKALIDGLSNIEKP
ncbi:MAG: hypothetical protein EOP54_11825 [Sphingobacteriales bacterium]|nr:MAG: hypothetical protein EOP54_11825 [Sphingobacteriales bacterium]